MARSLFKQAQKDIRNFRRTANADTIGDFRAVQSQLDAIYGNLRTSTAGLSANLTRSQARELSAIDRVRARNVRAGVRINKNAQAGAENRYGGALSGAITEALGPARAAASATRVISKGQRRGATILSEAGKLAVSTNASAAAEAQSAADYALAVALKSRFQADATTVAQMQFDLKQGRLNHQYALEEIRASAATQWKYRELELDKLSAAQADDPATYAGLTMAAASASRSYVGMQKLFNTKATAEQATFLGGAVKEGQYMNSSQVAQVYLAAHPAASEAEATFINAVAGAMGAAGAGPTTSGQLYGPGTSDEIRQQMVIDSIMESLLAIYPSFRGKEAELRAYLENTAGAQFSLNAAGLLEGAAQAEGVDTGFGYQLGPFHVGGDQKLLAPGNYFSTT